MYMYVCIEAGKRINIYIRYARKIITHCAENTDTHTKKETDELFHDILQHTDTECCVSE